MPIAESPPNPTIQLFNSQPKFSLSYLGAPKGVLREDVQRTEGVNSNPVEDPKWGEAQTSSNKDYPRKPVIAINRPAPFPHRPLVGFGKGGGKGHSSRRKMYFDRISDRLCAETAFR